MGAAKRFDIFYDRHIGFGIRWDNFSYQFELSIALIFFTVNIGFGRLKPNEFDEL